MIKRLLMISWYFLSVQFWSSLIILSHSLTLGHLDFSWSTLTLDRERQRRQEEGRSKQGRVESCNYNKILCMYRFVCVISFLDLACMVLHVVFFYHGMRFSKRDSVFSLAFPFPDRHGVMGFSCFG